MSELTVEEAIEHRNQLEVTVGAIQATIVQLAKFIDGEITADEYVEWVEENEEMFNEVGL